MTATIPVPTPGLPARLPRSAAGLPHRPTGNSRRHTSANARLRPGSAQPASPSPTRAARRRLSRRRSCLRRTATEEGGAARRPHADWSAVAVRISPANRLSMGRDESSGIGPRCVSRRPIRVPRRAAEAIKGGRRRDAGGRGRRRCEGGARWRRVTTTASTSW